MTTKCTTCGHDENKHIYFVGCSMCACGYFTPATSVTEPTVNTESHTNDSAAKRSSSESKPTELGTGDFDEIDPDDIPF
jgi:predicted  nucleic acid-binding Zn-ribbon protein